MDTSSLGFSPPINKVQVPRVQEDRILRMAGEVTQQTPEEIRKAAIQFEGYFLSYLLKVMRDTVPTGLIENKMGHLFDSFYDQEIGWRGAQAGGIGLADLMVRAYTQNQDAERKK
jgi:flagellar protein FlgJ